MDVQSSSSFNSKTGSSSIFTNVPITNSSPLLSQFLRKQRAKLDSNSTGEKETLHFHVEPARASVFYLSPDSFFSSGSWEPKYAIYSLKQGLCVYKSKSFATKNNSKPEIQWSFNQIEGISMISDSDPRTIGMPYNHFIQFAKASHFALLDARSSINIVSGLNLPSILSTQKPLVKYFQKNGISGLDLSNIPSTPNSDILFITPRNGSPSTPPKTLQSSSSNKAPGKIPLMKQPSGHGLNRQSSFHNWVGSTDPVAPEDKLQNTNHQIFLAFSFQAELANFFKDCSKIIQTRSQAATLISSICKMYLQRKHLESNLKISSHSALLIQKYARGYICRKKNNDKLEAWKTIRRYIRVWILRTRFKRALKIAEKRKKIIFEILTTEQSYLKSLNMMYQYYYIPLKTAEWFPESKQFTLFANLIQLRDFHTSFCTDLETRLANYTHHLNIADILLSQSNFTPVYTTYVNNFDDSISLVDSMSQDPNWVEFQSTIDPTKTHGHNLPSFLIQPVQRPPRYVLLLQELLKYTPETHSDFSNIMAALQKLKLVCDSINSNKAQHSNRIQLLTLSESMVGYPPTFPKINDPKRFLVLQSVLRKSPTMKSKKKIRATTKTNKRTFFLFKTFMIYAKFDGLNYHYRGTLEMNSCKIVDTPDLHPKSFMLETKKGFIVLSADSELLCQKWVKNISTVISDLAQKSIQSDSSPKTQKTTETHFSLAYKMSQKMKSNASRSKILKSGTEPEIDLQSRKKRPSDVIFNIKSMSRGSSMGFSSIMDNQPKVSTYSISNIHSGNSGSGQKRFKPILKSSSDTIGSLKLSQSNSESLATQSPPQFIQTRTPPRKTLLPLYYQRFNPFRPAKAYLYSYLTNQDFHIFIGKPVRFKSVGRKSIQPSTTNANKKISLIGPLGSRILKNRPSQSSSKPHVKTGFIQSVSSKSSIYANPTPKNYRQSMAVQFSALPVDLDSSSSSSDNDEVVSISSLDDYM